MLSIFFEAALLCFADARAALDSGYESLGTLDVSFAGAVESLPLEEVVVLADSGDVSLEVPRHSARGCRASVMMAMT